MNSSLIQNLGTKKIQNFNQKKNFKNNLSNGQITYKNRSKRIINKINKKKMLQNKKHIQKLNQ